MVDDCRDVEVELAEKPYCKLRRQFRSTHLRLLFRMYSILQSIWRSEAIPNRKRGGGSKATAKQSLLSRHMNFGNGERIMWPPTASIQGGALEE